MASDDGFLRNLLDAVKFEARLEDGTVVAQSDGVEFTVKEGKFLFNNDFNFSGDLVSVFIMFVIAGNRLLLPCIVKGC